MDCSADGSDPFEGRTKLAEEDWRVESHLQKCKVVACNHATRVEAYP